MLCYAPRQALKIGCRVNQRSNPPRSARAYWYCTKVSLVRPPLLAWVWPKRKMARGHGFLALEWIKSAVPPNGSAVLCSLAAPVKHIGKDAAGHIFHDFALKQSGLLGAFLGWSWRWDLPACIYGHPASVIFYRPMAFRSGKVTFGPHSAIIPILPLAFNALILRVCLLGDGADMVHS